MPELPEVETVVRGLARRLQGEQVKDVKFRNKKSFSGSQKEISSHLIGAKVKSITRRQKIVVVELSTGWNLLIHLKMTGQLIFVNSKQGIVSRTEKNSSRFTVSRYFAGGHPEKSYEQPLPHKHTHVIFEFDHGTLFFNDLRKFGWIKLLSQEETQKFFEKLNLGPEPLGKDFSIRWLKQQLERRRVSIKQVIMDQKVAAGVGNIYADEALFDARILPTTPANKLTDSKIAKLYFSIKKVLRRGIKYGGTTMNNYRTVSGSSGGMLPQLMVYGREGLPCKGCPGKVKRIKLGGRSTHYCPSCQK